MRGQIELGSLLCVTALLAACNWLPVTPEGDQVKLEPAQAVAGCERKGTVDVTTKSKLGFIPRGQDIVQEELLTLARNDAPRMGGNTVVAETQPQDGHQTYGIYACRRVSAR